MGTLGEVCDNRALDRYLHPYDLVCITHAGSEYNLTVGAAPSSSLALLAWCPRVVSGAHGGVAVFARRAILDRFRVEVIRPETGMVWVSYGARGMPRAYVGTCYMPPSGSTYYSNPACPDCAAH